MSTWRRSAVAFKINIKKKNTRQKKNPENPFKQLNVWLKGLKIWIFIKINSRACPNRPLVTTQTQSIWTIIHEARNSNNKQYGYLWPSLFQFITLLFENMKTLVLNNAEESHEACPSCFYMITPRVPEWSTLSKESISESLTWHLRFFSQSIFAIKLIKK